MAVLTQYLYGLAGLGSGKEIDTSITRLLEKPPFYSTDMGNDVMNYGTLHKPDYQFSFIPWIENKISVGNIRSNYDFISTRFHGCYMAAYTGQDGIRRGFHIHRGGTMDQGDNWNGIMSCLQNNRQLQYTNGVLFQPYKWEDEKVEIMNRHRIRDINNGQTVQTWGIISSTGFCHSALVYKVGDKWRLDRIEMTPCVLNMRIV